MRISFRATSVFFHRVRSDLSRPHGHAHERVGFVSARASTLPGGGLTVIAQDYFPVDDEHYLPRPDVGAFINADALRTALQRTYREKCSTFHIHMHEHEGPPWFGEYDLEENGKFVPDFFNVAPRVPHGALILSRDQVAGICWVSKDAAPLVIDEVVEIGAPLRVFPKWQR